MSSAFAIRVILPRNSSGGTEFYPRSIKPRCGVTPCGMVLDLVRVVLSGQLGFVGSDCLS